MDNSLIIVTTPVCVVFLLFTIAGIHYIFTRPDISFTKNIGYRYQLSLELLNGKTIQCFLYSNSKELELRHLYSYSGGWQVSHDKELGKIICFSTDNTEYHIPEKQILSKKITLIE